MGLRDGAGHSLPCKLFSQALGSTLSGCGSWHEKLTVVMSTVHWEAQLALVHGGPVVSVSGRGKVTKEDEDSKMGKEEGEEREQSG